MPSSAIVSSGSWRPTRSRNIEAVERHVKSLLGQMHRLVISTLSEFDFSALTEIDDSVREDILEELPTRTLVEGVRELESDDAVAILEDLDSAGQKEILEALTPVERVQLQRSLDYPENSAGPSSPQASLASGGGRCGGAACVREGDGEG